MLILQTMTQPPLWLRNGHLNTLYTSQCRKVTELPYKRERIPTADGDFLDIDWVTNSNNKLIILSHGLEGSSRRPYIQGMVNQFFEIGYDALAWNCRGCSGVVNNSKYYYHSGVSYDLKDVIDHALNQDRYKSIYLIGFSMGGNITLKYLGENTNSIDVRIKKAIAISTPVTLKDSALNLSRGFSKIYSSRFLKTLKEKALAKKDMFPELDYCKINKIKSLMDFDDYFTAPVHGFTNANDYYTKSSSRQFLPEIRIPTLIMNAIDDPFLGSASYPELECSNNTNLTLETPRYGGHVGFCINPVTNNYWSETRALKFINT